MTILALDHVNVRTANLDAMIAWYGTILGMTPGPRPDFDDLGGAWLYSGEDPIVHLVRTEAQPEAGGDVTLEHFALRATGLAGLRAKLDKIGAAYELVRVPGLDIVQVNVHDPDGNHIHVDYNSAEMD